MSEHKCKEWIKGRCTECDEHYTDYVDSLQAKIDSLKDKNLRIVFERVDLQTKVDELSAFIEIIWPLTALKSRILEKHPEYADIIAALKQEVSDATED